MAYLFTKQESCPESKINRLPNQSSVSLAMFILNTHIHFSICATALESCGVEGGLPSTLYPSYCPHAGPRPRMLIIVTD